MSGARKLTLAQKILPERDRELLSKEVALPEYFPASWRALTQNDRWDRVTRVFREDPAHAYDLLVSAWRAEGHQRVIETALEVLCRDGWRSGFVRHQGPRAYWLEADPRWKTLAEKLTKAVEVEPAAAASAYELAHRDALLKRARTHLRMADGVAQYAQMSSVAGRPEAVASARAWREALEEPGAAPHALKRVNETQVDEQPALLDPRARILCEDIITALGAEGHEAALPMLTTLWKGGQRELRIRAGNALLAFDDERAYDILTAQLPNAEPSFLRIAIRAAFARDPMTAYDRLSPHIETAGDRFFLEVVHLLYRDHLDAHLGRSARGWFRADPRWRKRLEPLANANSKSNASDPPAEQIAAVAYELVHRLNE